VGSNLPGLGPSEIAPLVNRDFDPTRAPLSREEYFVFTRVDGRTPLGQLVLISGMPEGQALTILRHLRQLGAIYLPGDDPKRPPAPDPDLVEERRGPVQIDEALLAEEVDLTEAQKRMILTKHASLRGGTYFSVLEVPRNADKRAVRKARDTITKDFHPDRPVYFGKRLGSYRKLLAEIVEIAMEAHEVLSDDHRRSEYLAGLAAARSAAPSQPLVASGTGPIAKVPPPRAETPAAAKQRAAELFEEACQHHVTGELAVALTQLAEVIRLDPTPKYLRRAADVAIRAQELRVAEEYAKKVVELDPQNASSHRTLGKVLRAAGRLPEARRALEQASRIDPENTHIAAELRAVIEGQNG
jgi:hypothetical protein